MHNEKNMFLFWCVWLVGIFILISQGCKTSVKPQPADCDPGYHQCENDATYCCMDTTSHYVSWTYDTLGAVNTWSEINDVAIIDENNIWAVGRLTLIDEGRTWVDHNMVHWDGSNWEYLQLYYTGNPPGSQPGLVATGHKIIQFGEDDIYVMAGTLFHWQPSFWEEIYIQWDTFPYGITNMWGTQPDKLYLTGGGGYIVFYNGETFTQMNSGTELYLNFIDGTDETNIWVSGYSESQCKSILLHYDGNNWETRYEITDCMIFNPDSLSGLIRCIKAFEEELIVVTSKGIYRCDNSTQGDCQLLQEGIDSRKYDIKGTELNDFFIAGEFQSILHYNGNSFRQYDEIPTSGRLYSIDKYNQTIIGGGYNRITHQALLIKGIQ